MLMFPDIDPTKHFFNYAEWLILVLNVTRAVQTLDFCILKMRFYVRLQFNFYSYLREF